MYGLVRLKKYLFPKKVYFKIEDAPEGYRQGSKCPNGGAYAEDVFSKRITYHPEVRVASMACKECIFFRSDIFEYYRDKKGVYILCNRKKDI